MSLQFKDPNTSKLAFNNTDNLLQNSSRILYKTIQLQTIERPLNSTNPKFQNLIQNHLIRPKFKIKFNQITRKQQSGR